MGGSDWGSDSLEEQGRGPGGAAPAALAVTLGNGGLSRARGLRAGTGAWVPPGRGES